MSATSLTNAMLKTQNGIVKTILHKIITIMYSCDVSTYMRGGYNTGTQWVRMCAACKTHRPQYTHLSKCDYRIW